MVNKDICMTVYWIYYMSLFNTEQVNEPVQHRAGKQDKAILSYANTRPHMRKFVKLALQGSKKKAPGHPPIIL